MHMRLSLLFVAVTLFVAGCVWPSTEREPATLLMDGVQKRDKVEFVTHRSPWRPQSLYFQHDQSRTDVTDHGIMSRRIASNYFRKKRLWLLSVDPLIIAIDTEDAVPRGYGELTPYQPLEAARHAFPVFDEFRERTVQAAILFESNIRRPYRNDDIVYPFRVVKFPEPRRLDAIFDDPQLLHRDVTVIAEATATSIGDVIEHQK
jgi:hypothetical protein